NWKVLGVFRRCDPHYRTLEVGSSNLLRSTPTLPAKGRQGPKQPGLTTRTRRDPSRRVPPLTDTSRRRRAATGATTSGHLYVQGATALARDRPRPAERP